MKKINNIIFISDEKMRSELIAFTAFSLKKVTTKTVKEENMDDSEEYLKIKNTTTHVNINKNPKLMDSASNIPRYVATPFPPLNFIQKGKICPKKASKAESCIYSGK